MTDVRKNKLDVLLLAAMRAKDIDVSAMMNMSQEELDALPLPGALLTHAASFAVRFNGKSEASIKRAVEVRKDIPVTVDHVEVPTYDPAKEREHIADSYSEAVVTDEAEPIATDDVVKVNAVVDVVEYSEDELREVVAKLDGKSQKVILQNAVNALDTAAINDKLLIKVVKERVAELKAQK